MKQHFTQSKESRNLSLKQISNITSEQAQRLLCEVRWADNNGKPVCPRCGCKQCVVYRSRAIFKCRDCKHQFSVTSGTIFHSRNLTVAQYLYVIAKFAIHAKGTAAIYMARECEHDPGTMFVLLHKLREAMALEMKDRVLSGEVEIDGCYIGKFVRLANRAEYRSSYRKPKSRLFKSIGVAKQRNGPSIVHVSNKETQLIPFVIARVDHGSTIIADMAKGWNVLGQTFEKMARVNHDECYVEDDGTNTNQAESIFSRVRRSEQGIYHHISHPIYAPFYAEEINWRENNCRLGDAQRFIKLLSLALKLPKSEMMSGYWQRGSRVH